MFSAMDNLGAALFTLIIFGAIFVVMRVCVLIWCKPKRKVTNRPVNRRVIQRIRIEPARTTRTTTDSDTSTEDRQGNIFTIPDESTNNSLQHRCPDFFYVEPSAEDAARIRAQLEKDEKDLPTYEEVMAMSLAQAQAGSMAPHNESNTSIAATTHIPVPPYSEINTNVSHPASQLPSVVTNSTIPPPHSGGATVWPMLTSPVGSSGDASTSRAAAAAATTTSTTVTIANSMSNTSV